MKKLVKGFASVILASMIFVVGCKPPTSPSDPPGGGSKPKITVTVAHDDNVENVEPATLSVAKGSTWSAVKSQITVTYKNGYGEAVWKENDASGDVLKNNDTLEKDTTVYACSEKLLTIKVEHDDNVEKVEPETLFVKKGEQWSAVKPRIDVTYKKGYGEAGWKKTNASGEDLKDNDTLEEDTIVYACSEKLLTIKVEHDDNVEKVEPETLFVKKGEQWSAVKSRINVTYKEGFVKAGWKKNNASGADLTDGDAFTEDTTVYALSKNTVTIDVQGDERIDLSSPLQTEISYNTPWSSIKAEIEGNIKPSADWKDDWNRGDYAVYEWRLGGENGEKINDDYHFTDNTTVYAVSNYAKWEFKNYLGLGKINMLSGFEGRKPRGKIIIPDGVDWIGDSAFSDCSKLESITIPKGVTSIEASAFYRCSSLASITIPEGVTSIEASAFYRCSSLASITIPEGVKSIKNSTFTGCSSLTSITIPTSVTSIGREAFDGCSKLESITLPKDLTSIGYSAFYGCSKLASITIPTGVTSIGERAFTGCSSLASSIIIPAGVKSIEDSAFSGCSKLASITIPASVTKIGNWAFEDCSSLASITIPEGVKSIGDSAFKGCSSLASSITIPAGVKSIGDSTFKGCSKLESITIPTSVTSIGRGAFKGCSKLESITIPAGVTSIGGEAFNGCSSLASSITIPKDVKWIADSTFNGCSKLESITLPKDLYWIRDSAFKGCSKLESITIPAGVTSIGGRLSMVAVVY